MDETFYLASNAEGKLNTAFGLYMNLSKPYAPFDVVGGNPYWGAANQAQCARLSGISTAFPQYSVPGLGRWVGYHPSPYKQGVVIGFDTEIRAEQASRAVTNTSPAGSQNMVRSIALCAKIAKDTGTNDQSTTSDAQLSQWQGTRKIKQVNMTTAIPENDRTSGPVKDTAQQAYIHMKGSPKRIHGIAQYRDNPEFAFKYDDVTGSSNQRIDPTEETYLHIGVFDRFQNINNTSSGDPQPGTIPYVMPDMAIRVKTKFIVLLSEPNNRINVDMGSAVAGGDGGDMAIV